MKQTKITQEKPLSFDRFKKMVLKAIGRLGNPLPSIMLVCMAILLGPAQVYSQNIVKGKVLDANSHAAIRGANVIEESSKVGTTTSTSGEFSLEISKDVQKPVLIISYLGYKTQKFAVYVEGKKFIEVFLEPEVYMVPELIVLGQRLSSKQNENAARIYVVPEEEIHAMPKLSVDEILAELPGVVVSRGSGILSSSATVSMRGMGSEQGRTLVLLDGIPLNKADGGSVQWNNIDLNSIKQVEVLKGPGSSYFGGNAMGGIISMVTAMPQKKIEGQAALEHGTYNSMGAHLNVGGKTGKFSWNAAGRGRKSDGYIVQPPDEIDSTVIKTNMEEIGVNLKARYDIDTKQYVQVSYSYFDDKRGGGNNFHPFNEMAEPDGTYTSHTNNYINVNYGFRADKILADVRAYYNDEDYVTISESLKGTQFTKYDVDSKRTDMGLMSSATLPFQNGHSLTFGLDLKSGKVDGNDIYKTSTDKVINQGTNFNSGLFLMGNIQLLKGKLMLTPGLRWDYAHFYDGVFVVENPTKVTAFLVGFQDTMPTADWNAFSPRLGLQYNFNPDTRIYAQASSGFRPPILDDLCRTGRMRLGLKLANPNLKPERIYNFELGADYRYKLITLSLSGYYSRGTDFIYYLATGDSAVVSNKLRPVLIKDNISDVDIYGLEFITKLQLPAGFNLKANCAYTSTEIGNYIVKFPGREEDLTGKELVMVPKFQVGAGLYYSYKFVNAAIVYRFTGKQWIDDSNKEELQETNLFDANLTLHLHRYIDASVAVYNIFDRLYYDTKGLMTPGRFIMGRLTFKL